VTIAIGSASGTASVAANGSFSASINVAGLSPASYPITYSLSGSADITAAANSSTSLMIVAPPVSFQAPASLTRSKKLVNSITLTFSGPLDGTSAQNTANYHLAPTAKGAKAIVITRAVYDPNAHTVKLTMKAFSTAKQVKLTIDGTPGHIVDSFGRPIDGGQVHPITLSKTGLTAQSVNGPTHFTPLTGKVMTASVAKVIISKVSPRVIWRRVLPKSHGR
jgi:hypothetical protein